MLSVAEASARIRGLITPTGAEEVAIADAAQRILAGDAVAGRALPPFDASAMDGYAVRAAEVPATLAIAGVIAAGQAPGARGSLPAGAALRIFTGAPMPPGADAVVIQEEVRADVDGARVEVPIAARAGDHVRRAGEDIAIGACAMAAGIRLGAGEIALLAALGIARPRVARRPRVAILSTGDELVDVAVTPAPGQIVSSNALALAAQIRDAGGEPVDLGIARDDREVIAARIAAGLADADVLITSGGVSVGDYDHVRAALADAGVALDFWKVAMKPGKPLAFGVGPGGVAVFGLPGNPVSSMVSFELFVRPALLAMQGARTRDRDRPRAPAMLPDGYRKAAGRAHYLRARLCRDGAALIAEPHPRQGSHVLSSLVDVDALIEIDAATDELAAGATAPALLLRAV